MKFKARRLSKNFLGLLESLLHIIPSVRPPSERVLMGIDEGKVGSYPAFKHRLFSCPASPARSHSRGCAPGTDCNLANTCVLQGEGSTPDDA